MSLTSPGSEYPVSVTGRTYKCSERECQKVDTVDHPKFIEGLINKFLVSKDLTPLYLHHRSFGSCLESDVSRVSPTLLRIRVPMGTFYVSPLRTRE